MKLNSRAVLGVVGLCAGIALFTTTVKSQQATQAVAWEYSTVTGSPVTNQSAGRRAGKDSWSSRAVICYANSGGCSDEEISATVPAPSDGDEAMMMAASKLGDEGWELTSATERVDSSGQSHITQTMFFRRLKTASK